MRKYDYDYKRVYETNYRILKNKHKNMSEKWYQEETQKSISHSMLQIFRTNISYRLKEDGLSPILANDLSYTIINELPSELYPNVQEWIDDKPISDIKYYGISIKDIMEQDIENTHKTYDFIDSLNAMLLYINHGCEDVSLCKNYFRRY